MNENLTPGALPPDPQSTGEMIGDSPDMVVGEVADYDFLLTRLKQIDEKLRLVESLAYENPVASTSSDQQIISNLYLSYAWIGRLMDQLTL